MQEGDGRNQFTYTPTNPVAAKEVQAPAVSSQQKTPVLPVEPIQWQASEFIDHEKNNNWFILLGLGTVVTCVVIYFMSQSTFSIAVVILAAIVFGITAKQKPRTMSYMLSDQGIKVGDKHYKYDDFKSFNMAQEGALWSIILQPTKRFMPSLTIYFDQNDGERIFDTLAAQMPHQERTTDSVDSFLRRIRF